MPRRSTLAPLLLPVALAACGGSEADTATRAASAGASGAGTAGASNAAGAKGGSAGASGAKASAGGGSGGAAGASGAAGSAGASGTPGASGTAGTAGTSGAAGAPGTAGTSGASGTAGSSGAAGTSGAAGKGGAGAAGNGGAGAAGKGGGAGSTGGAVTLTYTASTADFPNPERGFHAFRGHDDMWGLAALRAGSPPRTLVFGRILASAFKGKDFDAAFLASIQQMFDDVRAAGLKVNPRVAYNDGPEAGCPAQYGCDAPLAQVLAHIAQLKPLWTKNADVINVVDPGFIGGWGEWHTSSNGLDSPANKKAIMEAILAAVPTARMVYIRTPDAKRAMFTTALTASNAFDGSNVARVGHLNDCFLSSPDDEGTYAGSGWPLSQELDYIGSEGAFVPCGGESCALHARSLCPNALAEMAKLHTNHLNHDYFGGVIDRWKTDGCHDEISRRLGYRFTLKSATVPSSAKPGAVIDVTLVVTNSGFGELFNPRPLRLLVLDAAGGVLAEQTVPGVDPRRWRAAEDSTVSASITMPALASGTVQLALALPDPAPSLAADPRYAVRFANVDAPPLSWSAATGRLAFAKVDVIP